MIYLGLIGATVFAVLITYKVLVRKVVIWEPFTGLLYKNGKFVKRLPSGRYYLPRLVVDYHVKYADTRLRNLAIGGQEVLTSDNVGIKISLTVAFKNVVPEKVEQEVMVLEETIHVLAQLALRSAVGKRTVEELLLARDLIGDEVKEAMAVELEPIGVEVHAAGVKDVMFPGDLKRIMNEVIKAKMEGQAALEKARGESAALRNLANAARMLESSPGLMNLRLLQTMAEAAGNTYVMGLPPGVFPAGDGKDKGK